MRRAGIITTVAVTVGTVVLAMAAPASATWVQTQTPTISGERGSVLSGVACPAAHQCIGVGAYTDSSSHTRILAESWNGSTWTTLTTTDPIGSVESNMQAVTCPTAGRCVAAGSYVDGSGATLPLADVWDGSSWTAWAGTLPDNATGGQYTDVTCVSTSLCYATGEWTDAGNVSHGFVGKWDTTSWSVATTLEPSGEVSSSLNGIACVTSTLCHAVGSYRDAANNEFTVAEFFNGSTWSVETTPNPAGTGGKELNDVACSSATLCMAVGSGFAEQWNGSTWTLRTIATPHPHTGGPSVLLGVSCRAAAVCAAVGYYELDAVQTRVTETWDGQRWVLSSTPISNPNDSSILLGVSCTSVSSCMAVGSFHNSFFSQNHSLAESFSLVWAQQSFASPGPSISGSVDHVACPTIAFCVAVGSFETASDFETYAETYDPTFGWNPTTVPNPSTTNLTAVSCTSATACTAVGNGGDAVSGYTTLAERWNGSGWTVQPTPNHTGGGQGSYLLGVSCVGNHFCLAVGAYRDSSGNQLPYAVKWNGTSWTDTAAPAPSGSTLDSLNRVSCTSASSCIAVGSQNSTALAEVWNGTSWSVHNPTFSAGLTGSSFQDVSCPSAGLCVAVGSVFSTAANRRFALAESWNGTAWTDLGALVRGGTKFNFLNGVSCVAVDDCEAVGSSQTATSQPTTLTEVWNGAHWTLQTAPNPGGTQATVLSTVSCPSRISCVAGGYYSMSNGNDDFLIETYS